MDDSSGIAWNTMRSSAGFVGPQYAAWRFKTSRRLGSNSSTPNGPVPMARVSSSLPSPAAEDVLGGRPLLPPLCELGLGLERLVHPDQVLVDQGLPLLPDVEPLHVWLDVRWERGARIRQGPTLWLGPGAAGEREREPRRAREEIAPPQASLARVVPGRPPRHPSGRSHCLQMPGFVRQGPRPPRPATCPRR